VKRKKILYSLAAPIGAFLLALLVASLALLAGKHNPFVAFQKMAKYAGSVDSLVVVLNKSLPLFIAGLAVAVGFKMNLFNIGVEGQYRLAAIVAAAAGAAVHLPAPIHVAFIMVVAIVTGALWAGIAGALKVTRNVNEVVATIMLNGIAAGVVGMLLRWKPFAKVDGAFLSTRRLPRSAWMPSFNKLFGLNKNVTASYSFIVIAALIGIVVHILLTRTRFGFDLRASGLNPGAARSSGVNPKAMVMRTMLISGGLAGLIGLTVLFHQDHRFTQEFPTGLGFGGISVALVGRQKVGGIALAAVLFGLIERVSQVLNDPPLFAPKEVGIIMQGTMILSAVIAYEVVRRRAEATAVRDAAAATAVPSIATVEAVAS
jgi:general nucleoside transport system permease protein